MPASHQVERGGISAPWAVPHRALEADLSAFLVRVAGAVAASIAVAGGLVIVVRRLSGAIEPAGPAPLLGVVAAGIALVFTADAARRVGASRIGPAAVRSGLVIATAALALPPRTSGPGGWLPALAAMIAVAWAVIGRPRATGRGGRQPPRATPSSGSRRRTAVASRRRDEPVGVLRQRFERRELPAGAERVRGRVVVEVPAGARTGYGHLGFCPAFVATPTVEVTTAYDGVEATVAAAEILPWGIRVECRLAEPAEEPLSIPVDLVAHATAVQS